jgi:hypothetical protein
MTIIRCVHNKNYSVINNTILSDKNLSWRAKGIWTYAMSRPDDWVFSVSHLSTVSKEGEDAVYSAIKELQNSGYCTKKYVQGEKGRYSGIEYTFFEEPQGLKECLPNRDFPDAVEPDPVNPELLSTEVLLSTEEEKTVCPTPPVGASVSVVVKNTSDGKEIIIRQNDIFKRAIGERKEWTTAEIMEAWDILVECTGAVNDGFGFIAGTIKNRKVKKKFDKMAAKVNKKNEERSWNTGIIQPSADCQIPSEIDITKLL